MEIPEERTEPTAEETKEVRILHKRGVWKLELVKNYELVQTVSYLAGREAAMLDEIKLWFSRA